MSLKLCNNIWPLSFQNDLNFPVPPLFSQTYCVLGHSLLGIVLLLLLSWCYVGLHPWFFSLFRISFIICSFRFSLQFLMEEYEVKLYAWNNFWIWPFQLVLFFSINIFSMLILVWFMCCLSVCLTFSYSFDVAKSASCFSKLLSYSLPWSCSS